jgi:ArsR family transcriptional regulator, arsenate/arsenite/antimonite-responsive transcriptional repressor
MGINVRFTSGFGKINTFVGMNPLADVKKIERISKALGDPYRLQMMEAIRKEQGWMPCAMLIELFDLAQSTVSHHLKQLVDAELLITEKDGRSSLYKINTEVLGEYVGYLNRLGGREP